NEGGTVIDPAAKPQVSALTLSGRLEAGQTLTATYAFAANGGNAQDKSAYAWGHEGTTGPAVADGQSVATSGQVPGRALTTTDVGKVMELSVQAKNGADVTGNTLTAKSSETGNGTEGGNEGGTVIDPAAKPQISALTLAGRLEAGQTLTATYAFAANGGNAQDKSAYAWGYEGTTGPAVATGESVATSGQVPGRALTTADVGKVMELSVMAKNGAGTTGNTLTVKSSETGNGTEGGNEGGTVIDPAAKPQVSALKLAGRLEAGQTLTATYAFAANGGNAQDKSAYAWGYEGATGPAVADGQSVTTSGQVPGRALTTTDVGKVMELSVQAKNGADVTGNTLTVKSSETGNGTEGGNEGGTVAEKPAIKEINTHANSYTYSLSSGFPKTGFKGATFTLIMENAKASDYTWISSEGSRITVQGLSEGAVVTINDKPASKTVTITGLPNSGSGETLKYSFTLNSWFTSYAQYKHTHTQAAAFCSSNSGTLASFSLLKQHINHVGTNIRGVGIGLWNEWGNVGSYSTANLPTGAGYYWSSESTGNAQRPWWGVGLGAGTGNDGMLADSGQDPSSTYGWTRTICVMNM
ncbi:hypothetical protein V5L74_003564, partial [Enterobacter hormaechei]